MTLRAGWLKRLAVVLCLSLRGGRVERERGEGEVLRCLFQLGNGDILYGESDIYHTWCFLSRRFQKNAFLLSPLSTPTSDNQRHLGDSGSQSKPVTLLNS